MAEKKRQCGTCRFFVESESGGHGKCTHPKRDKSLRDMVLLRPNELGCRTRWGTSLWQDPADESDPFAPNTPQQPTLPDPIPAQLQYDDEVTSVSIAGSKSARPSFEDDVVDSGAVGSSMGSWSDSLQEERRRLLMNSDRDAVAGARKRHMEKQAQQRELIPFADDETEAPEPDTAEKQSPEPEESVAASKHVFPPDDYVEEERSADKDEPIFDDEMVDEGVRPGRNRSPRVQKLMREKKSPKNHKAMGLGTPAEMSVTSHNPEKREQWNSVPSMTPGFALPLMDMKPVTSSTPLRVSASAAPMSMAPTLARPVSQARELVSEDRLRQERSRRHVSVPMAVDHPREQEPESPQPSVTNRPRLSQAPTQRSAPVDRLKSSPLRGYHPAVKAAAARAEESEAAERQPKYRPQPGQVAPTSQPQGEARPFTSHWRSQAEADKTIAQPMQEDGAPIRQGAPVPNRERPGSTREVHPADSQPERRPNPKPAQHMVQHQNTSMPDMRDRREPDVRMSAPAPNRQQRQQPAPATRIQPDTPYFGEEIEISPEVPRACGTCASFRPSGVKGRGSCANEFAGPIQRVVFEQDLACEHTYGSLWIPADERVWLEELNQDYAPTPRVDAMLAKKRQRKTVVLPDLEELTS